MSSSIMWFSVALMVACLLIRKDNKIAEILCGAAWLLFGLYWITLIPGFYEKGDYTNIILVVLLFLFCLLLSLFASRAFKDKTRRENPKHPDAETLDKKVAAFFDLTRLVAVICIVYMPFKLISFLNHMLIDSVASQTVFLLNTFGYDAVQIAYDQIAYNGISVSVILACTAIESLAFFTGLVLTARRSPPKRRTLAFLVTVPVIYLLNLARNVFVIVSYGDIWFGPNSFEIGHHYIAKAASGIALIVLAYAVLKLLPELMDLVLDLWTLVTDELRLILKIRPGSEKK